MPRGARKPSPESPSDAVYAAILAEAAPIAGVTLALDAELAVSALLGGVYAATAPRPAPPSRLAAGNGNRTSPAAANGRHPASLTVDSGEAVSAADKPSAPAHGRPSLPAALVGDPGHAGGTARATAVREFAADFGRYLARRRTAPARAVRAALAALLPDQVSAPKSDNPAWLGAAGKVACTGTWAARDTYGDQTSYIATFSYADPERGGPDHAVSYLLDHNLGIAKSVSIAAPGQRLVDGWREAAKDDPDVVLEEVAADRLRAEATAYLAATDGLDEPPRSDYVEERTFGEARLRLLPEPTHRVQKHTLSDAERNDLVADFLGSPEAELDSPDRSPSEEVVRWCARAAVDFAVDDNAGDPLRWSPTSVELMLLDWAPRQLSHQHQAAPWLPEVLDAFVSYAGRVRGQATPALEATREAVTESVVDYTNQITGETLGEPVTDTLARMVADGVDPFNEEEVFEWVLADRARRSRD